MVCCITICIINVILSLFIYEIKDGKEEIKEIEKNKKVKFLKKALFIIVLYGMLYGAIVIGQNNGKLFIQYKLSDYISINKVAIYISIIIALSRVVRLVSNLCFMKVYNKLKDNILYLISCLLGLSFLLFIIGNFINNYIIGAIVMALGFFIFLAIRDPLENYLKTILMKNVNKKDQEQAALYFQMSRKISTFLISFAVTSILFKFKLIHVYIFLFIISIVFLFIVRKLFKLIKTN